MSSRRRAGLRQYRSREGPRKRSLLGRRRRNPHWIDLSAMSRSRAQSPLQRRGRARGGTRRNRCPAPPGVVQGASNERKQVGEPAEGSLTVVSAARQRRSYVVLSEAHGSLRLYPKGGPWRSLGAPCVPLESVKQRPRQANTGRVHATLRRASKFWTSFSRSA